MTRDEVIDMVATLDFEFMGKQNWNAFDKYEAFAQLVEEKAYAEGRRDATLEFLKHLRHFSYAVVHEEKYFLKRGEGQK